MIRPSVALEIYKLLEATENLDRVDFSLTQEMDEHKRENLVIRYIPNPAYEFRVVVTDETLWASLKPGRFRAIDYSDAIKDDDELFDQIHLWAQHLSSDLTASPLLRRVALVELELAKYEEKINNLPNQYLSLEEAELLKARLSALEELLANQLKQSMKDGEELDTKLEELSKEISYLKEQTEGLKKPGLFRSMIVRLGGKIASQNPKDLAAGTEAIMRAAGDMSKLLPPEIGQPVSEGAGHIADAAKHIKELE